MGDLLGHGNLKNLEILEWSAKKRFYDFPKEIGLLCNLRRLDFSETSCEYIAEGILSKLVKLEELEVSSVFDSWGCKEAKGGRLNASLEEIESLPLTTLRINVPKGSILAEKLVKNITRFNVSLGSHYDIDKSIAELRVADVDESEVTMSWMTNLLRRCGQLELKEVRNLKNVTCLQDSVEHDGFPKLKILDVCKCKEMEYLVDPISEQIHSCFLSHLKFLILDEMDNLEGIWDFSKIEAPCFSNLIKIDIYTCPKMKHVFPLSVARELGQLQSMVIAVCEEMEEIFCRDHEVDDGNQVASSSIQLTPPTVESTSTPNHKSFCPTPSSLIPCLPGRQKHPKMVSSQQMVEENTAKVDEKVVDHFIIFPKLKILELLCMRKLRVLYDGNHGIELPSLEVMSIDGVDNLSYGSLNAPRLKEIQIRENMYYPSPGENLNAFVKKTLEMLGPESDIEEIDDIEDDDIEENDIDNIDEIH